MNELLEKKKAYSGLLDEAQKAVDAGEMDRARTLMDEAATVKGEIDRLQAGEDMRRQIADERNFLNTLQPITFDGGGQDPVEIQREEVRRGEPNAQIPTYARTGRVTAFKGPNSDALAYRFGRFVLGSIGHADSRVYCDKHGIQMLSANESVNAAGGFLVPPEFGNYLIDLREQYGVFRRSARIEPMASDTKTVLRRASGLTAYFVDEEGDITDSQKGWDRVGLTAKKLAALAYYSTEINEDAIIAVGNDLAEEISYAFAKKEDACGFTGDGTSTYGKIVGVTHALTNLDTVTIENIAGLTVATGNAYSEITLNDFISTAGKLPKYADDSTAKWFCHRTFYYETMLRVALAAGGVPAAEVAAGLRVPSFLGYPVEFVQTLPNVEGNSQVCCLFGDLRRAATMGERRMVTISASEHYKFANDQLAIRGTERFDINVHDVGNASSTPTLRQPCPMVGLITKAS